MDGEKEVKRLAELARLSVADGDIARFAGDFEHILSYVGKLNELSVEMSAVDRGATPHVNAFREDGEPHETGKYTESITAQFPNREGDALSVKAIISHD